MNKNLNEYNISQLFKIVLLALLVIVTGCSSFEGPDYKVTVNTSGKREITSQSAKDEEAIKQAGAPLIDPVVKYGKGVSINQPLKRKYSSEKGTFSLDFVNIAVEEFVSIVFTEMLGKNYSLDSAIKGNVTVQTRGQINSSQLLSRSYTDARTPAPTASSPIDAESK